MPLFKKKELKEEERKQLEKEREDILLLISQLEEEFQKASITEAVYKETKEKYEKKLAEINKKLGIKEEKKKEDKKKKEEENPYKQEGSEEEGPVFIDPLNPPKEVEEVKVEENREEVGESRIGVELEKIKAFVESLRETDKTLNEQIRGLAEALGEVRSMVFQTDGALKELEMKVEKLSSDIEEISPEKIDKRIREIEKRLESFDVFKEKTEKKLEDIGQNVSKISEFLRTAGGLENLMEVSKEIKKKSEEIKEVVKYVERLATQVEKAFVESTKNLQDFPVIKGRLEMLEESVRDISKTIEGINARLENVATLKDLESFRTDVTSLKSQIDEINKVLPIAEAKIPESIKRLREERDDVLLLINSLEEELKQGKISLGDYNSSKSKALEKLRKIEDKLIEEWKKVEKFIESGGIEAIPEGEAREAIGEKKEEVEKGATEENVGEEILQRVETKEVKEERQISVSENGEKKLSKNIETLANQIEKSFSEIVENLKALIILRERLETLESMLLTEISEELERENSANLKIKSKIEKTKEANFKIKSKVEKTKDKKVEDRYKKKVTSKVSSKVIEPVKIKSKEQLLTVLKKIKEEI